MYPQRPGSRTQSRPLQRRPQSSAQKLSGILFGPPGDRSVGRIVGSIIGLLILSGLVFGIARTTVEGLRYSNIAWKPYAPPDNSFKVKFPGTAEQSTESRNISGDMWQVVSLEARHRNHIYMVEYVDLHMVVTKKSAPQIIRRFLNDAFVEDGDPSVSGEETTLARNPAISFETITLLQTAGPVPKNVKAKARGLAVLRNNRLFVVWTASDLGDVHTKDLTEFINSFEVPPPAEITRVF